MVVCEFALRPTPGAVSLFCPVPDQLLDTADPARLAAAERLTPLVYVGNRYDPAVKNWADGSRSPLAVSVTLVGELGRPRAVRASRRA